MNLTLPNGKVVLIEVGMKYKDVFGYCPTPARFRVTLKNHEARVKRLAMNCYKRIKDRTYDLRMYMQEIANLAFTLFMASIVVNNAGIIKSI